MGAGQREIIDRRARASIYRPMADPFWGTREITSLTPNATFVSVNGYSGNPAFRSPSK